MIIALIRQHFPDHGFLAEEGETRGWRAAVPGGADQSHLGLAWEADPPPTCRWIIDPLDGTVNFAHGYPPFCVSIALEAEGAWSTG